jgi:type I restriction enzyme S subunit
VLATPIPLPPLAEQSRIVARVNELRSLCADLRKRLQSEKSLQVQLASAIIQAR